MRYIEKLNLSIVCMLVLLVTASCSNSDKQNSVVTVILKNLEAPSDSEPHLQAVRELERTGTNAVPALLSTMERIGDILKTKDPANIHNALQQRDALHVAFDTLGTNMQPFAEYFVLDLDRGKNPADAAYALVQMGSQYYQYIARALTNQYSSVKLAAAGTICDTVNSSLLFSNSVPVLIPLLADEESAIRVTSAKALGVLRVAPHECLPALMLRARTDPDPMVKMTAIGAISQFGTNADLIKSELTQAFNLETNPAVRRAFIIANKAIDKAGSQN